MASIELSKSELPYNTEVSLGGLGETEIFIIKETEKAFLMKVYKKQKKGTSNYSEILEIGKFWCPKSVWNDNKHFSNSLDLWNGVSPVIFNKPRFLKFQ